MSCYFCSSTLIELLFLQFRRHSSFNIAVLPTIELLFLQFRLQSCFYFCSSAHNQVFIFAVPPTIKFLFLQFRPQSSFYFCSSTHNQVFIFAVPLTIVFLFLQFRPQLSYYFYSSAHNQVFIFAVPPTFETQPQSAVAQEKTEVVFHCKLSGSPPPAVHWTKDGDPITPSDYVVETEDQLRIMGLIPSDSGYYQCHASNELGSRQATAQLVIRANGEMSIISVKCKAN